MSDEFANVTIAGAKAATIKGPTILLFSGTYFNFERPEETPVTIEDVARGLSHICRFAGQCPRFYSVAEHSIHVSQIVSSELAWEGLMHDAAEAFIGDVAKPLKVLLGDYGVIERRVELAIAQQFGLADRLPPDVKRADVRMLRLEQQSLMRNGDNWEWTKGFEPPEGITLSCLAPDDAMAAFLQRALELRPASTPPQIDR
jgi:hypothetical protein